MSDFDDKPDDGDLPPAWGGFAALIGLALIVLAYLYFV
jgi:hypothetical protein